MIYMNDSSVGNNINASNASWTFSGATAKQFPDHVKKSVPLYTQGQDLIVDISDFFVGTSQKCYDLGCSTGDLTKKLADRHAHLNISVVGIDIEADMIEQAKQNTQSILRFPRTFKID